MNEGGEITWLGSHLGPMASQGVIQIEGDARALWPEGRGEERMQETHGLKGLGSGNLNLGIGYWTPL